jgi:predicted Zn-dependent protease
MTAGLLATPSRRGAAPRPAAVAKASRERRRVRSLSIGIIALVGLCAAWGGTRWLMASTFYAAGVRHSIAGQPAEALASFRRSRDLMPWLTGPAEAFAHTALALATPEADPGRRLEKLREAAAALDAVRDHAFPGVTFWGLTAQIALAEARAGERNKLPVSVEAFRRALLLRPQDVSLLAQSGLAWLESADPVRARDAAQRALSLPGGRDQWLVWAVLSRAAHGLGDEAQSGQAAERARSLAPPGARHVVEGLLSGGRGP